MKNVKICLSRFQDGEEEINVYTGRMRFVNGKTVVSFDNEGTSHLLKITEERMDWTRTTDHNKKKMSLGTSFLKGGVTAFDYYTPAGMIKMDIRTRLYEYKVSDTHEVRLSYTIEQGGEIISDYEVSIKIVEG